jgi:hypothetical protein
VSDITADNGFLTKSLTANNLASYVTARVNLNFLGDTGTGIVNLDTQNLTVSGTTNQIDTVASTQTLTVSLPSTLVVPGTMRAVGTANFDSNVTMDIGLTVEDFFLSNGSVRLLGPTPFGTTNILTVNGNTTQNGTLTVTDHLVVTGSTSSTLNALTSLQVDTTAVIGGDTNIGGSLDVTNTLTVSDNQGNGSTIDSELSMSSNRITNLSNPVSSQDAVTKSYVDTIVSGGLNFRGSFRADTGEIISGANTGSYLYNCPGGAGVRVSLLTGDYYIVANAGGNFYCSGDLLNIGDSVLAVADAAGDTSTINDWATLESDNIEGTGLANTVPLWTDSQVLGNSIVTQTGTSIVNVGGELLVVGNLELSSDLLVGGGTIDMGTGSITNLVTPTANDDAATKAYVDASNSSQVTAPTLGTDYTLTFWTDGANREIGDSTLIMTEVSPGAANPYSLKFGGGSVASGLRNSVAFGFETTSSGASTFSTGFQTTASGTHAVSFNEATIASGDRSAAFGKDTVASGSNCFAIGNGTTAATSLAFAGGLNSTANPSLNGTTAFAYGTSVNVTGQNAVGFGQSNTVSGTRALVSGISNTVSGTSAFVTGFNNNVAGNNSIVAGNNNSNIGSNSFAIGSFNNGASFAKKLLIGEGLTALAQGQATVLVGQYNATLSGDTVFAVGSGSGATGVPTTTQTAIAVKEGGDITMEVLQGSTEYTNDAAAATGGVSTGALYQNNGVVQINRGGGSTTDPLAGAGPSIEDLNDLTDVLTTTDSAYFLDPPSGSWGSDNLVLGFNAASTEPRNNNIIIGNDGGNIGPNADDAIIIGHNAAQNANAFAGGTRCVVIGNGAMQDINWSVNNTVVGYEAAKRGFNGGNGTGYNICIGAASGPGGSGQGATGSANYAIGTALYNLTSGSNNIGVGASAGNTTTTGSNNTFIGNLASFPGFGATGTGSNNTTIGYLARASADNVSNEITLGNSSVTVLRCAVTSITSLSDERDKKDITDLEYGLDFIESLQPKQFTWDNRTETFETTDLEGNSVTEEIESANKGKKDFGFIAQEVQSLDNDILRLVYDENPDKLEMSYGKLVPILVKAVKELSDKVKALENA